MLIITAVLNKITIWITSYTESERNCSPRRRKHTYLRIGTRCKERPALLTANTSLYMK